MEKGSPEAIAWGRRMRKLREGEKTQKVNKPISVKSGKVKTMSERDRRERRRERRHHKRGNTFHVIPDLFYAGAAIELVGPAAENVFSGFRSQGLNFAMDTVLPWSINNQVIPAIMPAAELAVIGVAIQKIAKYVGLNKIGTKDVKVF